MMVRFQIHDRMKAGCYIISRVANAPPVHSRFKKRERVVITPKLWVNSMLYEEWRQRWGMQCNH
jgi:hypothetical protein